MLYSEDKINEIIESLIEGTKSGYIKWTLKQSIFNSDTRHNMSYSSDDDLTIFDIDIKLDKSLTSLSGVTPYLYIRNNDLVNNKLPISGHEYKELENLEKLIFEMFIKPNTLKNPPKTGILDNILANISKQHMRQEKINDLLDEDIQAIEKEAKELVEKEQPKRKKFLGIF